MKMASSGSGSTVPVGSVPENDRTVEIRNAFAAIHIKKPDFYVRVPGRVNLIGEHVDYCGYSVCPMALEQDIFLAVSIEEEQKLFLHNLDPKFDEFECDLKNFEITVGEGSPKWYQYFLCGVKGVLDALPKGSTIKGMKIVVSGTVPQSAGLSSSSALVSAAALATTQANGIPMSKERMANLCAECERFIGTQGGGMDQAIAFLATKGCAKLIDFSPLRSTDIVLPSDAVFVIAHSLTRLNKAATADFNCRVIECRLAAQIIAQKRGLKWTEIKKLADIEQALSLNLEAMIALTEETLHESPYSKEEVIEELCTTSAILEQTSLTPNTRHVESFKLRQRALHVFQEALRVKKFVEACSRSNNLEASETLKTLGQLMSDSHASLRDLYECSHPQLDRLVNESKAFTLGTRLTGAGWGGCTVSLLLPDKVGQYMEFLKETFYKELGVIDGFESILFATSPQGGACIYV